MPGDCTFLRPHEMVPEVPGVTREESKISCCNSRKIRTFSPQGLFRCSVTREIPPFFLSLESVLDTLAATQEVPRHTRLYSRGISSVLPQLKKSPVSPSSSRDEGPFPCFIRKGIPALPSHLKRRHSYLESREELPGTCHHSKRP